MAGGRSPWGSGGESSSDGEDGAQAPDDKPDGEDAEPTPPDSEPARGRGPRNPWLPPSDGPRRSAGIEDIFRNREQRRTAGPGGPRGPQFRGMPRRPDGKSWTPLVIAGVVLVWIGFSSVHMLSSKEEGLVSTFGKYSRTIGNGVSWTLPWPFQDVDVEDVTSINRFNVPGNEAEDLVLTSDKNLVDLSYLVRWRIKNLRDYRYQLIDPEQTIQEVAEAAMRASIAQISLDDAFSGAGRAQVEQDVRTRMQRVLDFYRSGVSIEGVDIKKTDPPTKVIGAFQEVTSAQQDAERDRSNANAAAQQMIARAQGDAAAFDKVYGQYKLAPGVTKRRLYYETMERVLANNPKIITEDKGGTPFLNIPVPQPTSDDSLTVTAPSPPVSGGGQ